MEKPQCRAILIIIFFVILLGATAFSCCITAEFKKLKEKDVQIDGSLCYLPRSPAFGLSVAALVCLSVAQIVGTTVVAAGMCAKGGNKSRRTQCISITLLVLSWLSFGLAAVMLGTGSSMSNRQPYGRGWMNGECYVVKDGVYAGSAVLAVTTVVLVIGLTVTTMMAETMQRRTGPDEERNQGNEEQEGK